MCAWEFGARTEADDDAAFSDAVESGQDVRQRERVPEQDNDYRKDCSS